MGIFGAWPILGTKGQDFSASAASIHLFIFLKSVSWASPNIMKVQY